MKQIQKAREQHGFWNVWFNNFMILYMDINSHDKINVFYNYCFQIMA